MAQFHHFSRVSLPYKNAASLLFDCCNILLGLELPC
ncbi:hypothetical protein COLO4_34134 [Corchorus olitorius]|uniref:Uncharacterized protein n=1 Tax=Corchorus olitorius TaxID=93759 RepID=A0A1R3GNE8_9ROSI|nr:hypothetical protein COLO4_34134 [Corchorus olitorius]